MGQYDHNRYVSMTMEFRCNLKCVHCMIEGTMDRLTPESMEQFDKLMAHNSANRQWTGLILTGSEITLRRDLPELAKQARAAGFEHVRIQTHGMHLGRLDYTRKLVEAGVDEFFVSIAGADEASHDGITLVPGSFAKSVRGLEHIDRFDNVASITNTVVTEKSFRLLPQIVDALAHVKKLTQMEFWFYFPMAETDEKQLVASHVEALPYLKAAIRKAEALGRSVEVKNFPECLLEDDGDLLLNDQPQLYIDPDFWLEFERNGFYQCAYREVCASKQCLGLNTAYIEKFGLHERELHPIKVAREQAMARAASEMQISE